MVRPLPLLINPKLHILSPISDKSAQELVSENSEIIKNGTHLQTPDESSEKLDDHVENVKLKKRPPNKTLLLINGDEIQGSDSGISLHSRDKNDSSQALPQDLKDLPFDMPKLRRRRIVLAQVCLNALHLKLNGQSLKYFFL